MVQRFRAEDSGSCRLKLAHCKSQGASLTGHLATTRCPPRVNRVSLAACRSLPVFPEQRTSSGRPGMSQTCHEQTFTVSLLSVARVDPFEECKMLIFQIWRPVMSGA